MGETAETAVWAGLAGGAPDLSSMVGALVAMCALIYVGVWLTAKLLKISPQSKEIQKQLACLATLRLGKDSTLHVVQAGRRALLIGDGARGVSLLAELDELLEPETEAVVEAEPEEAAPAVVAPTLEELLANAHKEDGPTRRLPRGVTFAAGLLVALTFAAPAQAQALPPAPPAVAAPFGGAPFGDAPFGEAPLGPSGDDPTNPFEQLGGGEAAATAGGFSAALGEGSGGQELTVKLKGGGKGGLTSALKVAFILTALMFLPAILTSVTAFTRVVIVLSFVRRAIGSNTLPPNQVIVGLSLFLTMFVMAPVGKAIHEQAYLPYTNDTIKELKAVEITTGLLKQFMLANTRKKDLGSFVELSRTPATGSAQDLPFWVVAPAFMTSELRTAFLMAFAIYLPFLVIDLVVASALLSVGLIMVPPPLISAPLKILLFVLADGWYLLCRGLVMSFNVPGVTS